MLLVLALASLTSWASGDVTELPSIFSSRGTLYLEAANDVQFQAGGFATSLSAISQAESRLAIAEQNITSTNEALMTTQDMLASTQRALSTTQNTLAATVANLSSTEATLATTQAALATTNANLATTNAQLSMLQGVVNQILAAISPSTPASSSNLINVVQLFNTVTTHGVSIGKLVAAVTTTPSSPTENSLFSSTTLNNAISTNQNNLQLVVNAMSSTSSVTNLVNVVALQTTVNTQQTSIGKLVTAASTLSPGNENNLWSITSLSNRLTGDELSISSQNTTLTSHSTQLSALSVRLTNDESTISSQGSLISALTTRVTGDESTISSQGASITAIQTHQTTDEANINSLTTQLTAAQSTIVYQSSVITTQSASISSLGTRLSGDESTISSQGSSLLTLTNRLSSDEGTIATLSATASSLNTASTSQAQSISSLSASITALQSTTTSQGSSITGLQNRAATDESTINSQGSSISNLNTQMTSAMSSITAQASTIVRRSYNEDSELNLVDSPDFIGDMSSYLGPPTNLVAATWSDGRIIYAEKVKQDTTTGCYAGWVYSNLFAVNPARNYEFSIWMKATTTAQANYMGFTVYDSSKNTIGGAWGNPYFVGGAQISSNWRVHSGYLMSSTSPNSNVPEATDTDWIMPSNAAYALIRFGMCYGAGNNVDYSLFAFPSVRVIQPKLVDSRMNQLFPVNAAVYLGRYDIPISWASGVPSWNRISSNYCNGWNTGIYSTYVTPSTQLMTRFCFIWTDSGDNSYSIYFRLYSYNSGSVLWQNSVNFGNTWSGSGLIHNECDNWIPASVIAQCGYGWSNCCYLAAYQNEGRNVNMYEAYIEVSLQPLS